MGRLPANVSSVEVYFDEAKMMVEKEIKEQIALKSRLGLLDSIKADIKINSLRFKSSKLTRIDQCLTTFAGITSDPVKLSEDELNTLSELKGLLGKDFEPVLAALLLDGKTHIDNKKSSLQSSYLALFNAIHDVKSDEIEVLTPSVVDTIIKNIYGIYEENMQIINESQPPIIMEVPTNFNINKEEIKAIYDEICSRHQRYDSISISFDDAYSSFYNMMKNEYIITLINNLKLSNNYILTSTELNKLKVILKSQIRSSEAILKSVGLTELFEPVDRKEDENVKRIHEAINNIMNNSSGFYENGSIEPEDISDQFTSQLRRKL